MRSYLEFQEEEAMDKPLEGRVALVAGATRGAGRAIAAMLGEAGATVYCSSRSTRGDLASAARPETIDETAEMVNARGGIGIAVKTDHTVPEQVAALMKRIRKEKRRLDILVNNVNGDDLIEWKHFWKLPLDKLLRGIERGIHSHVITAHYALPLMIETKRGLLVEVTDGDGYHYRGTFLYDIEKTTAIRLAIAFGYELRKKNIAAVAITPGFIRSEQVLEILGVKEENWRDAIGKRPEFAASETPFFIGKGIAALAADPHVMKKTGRVFNSLELAREYGFTDVDGRLPDVWTWFTQNMPQFAIKKLDDTFYKYCGTA
jgi:NAD(P)-dependent dehydrogenase (short-subunit alcohol dehydrogenase family)